MGWLIDPAEQSVTVYPKDRQPVYQDGAETQLLVPGFAEGFELRVGQLFGWLQVQR